MDFLHSKSQQFAIEQVTTLPAGLGIAHRGRLVLYSGQLFYWDGSQWVAFGRPYVYELPEIQANSEVAYEDDANYLLCDDNINPINYKNYYRKLSIYQNPPGAYISGNHGRIVGVGRFSQSAGDIALWHGVEVVVESTFGSYFAIADNFALPQSLDGKAFPIVTGDVGNLYKVRMAHFRFDATISKWRLLSFECIQWNARIDLSPAESTTTNPIIKTLNVPIPGIYQVDVFVKVREVDANGTQVPDIIQKTLEIATDDDQYKYIDIGANGTGIFVNSLQGSKIVACMTSTSIYLRIGMYNGYRKILDSGYVDIEYLGKQRINKTWIV